MGWRTPPTFFGGGLVLRGRLDYFFLWGRIGSGNGSGIWEWGGSGKEEAVG